MRRFLAALPALVLILGTGLNAVAAPTLTFDVPNGDSSLDNSISYAGNTSPAPLIGKNLQVNNVFGTTTPSNSGVTLTIQDGAMNFTTGNFISQTTNGGGNPVFTFGPGGTIGITGGISSIGISPTTTPLTYSGTFTSNVTVTFVGTAINLVGGVHLSLVNSTLTNYYGMPGGTYSGQLGLTFTGAAPDSTTGGFMSEHINGGADILTSAPEPATLLSALTAVFFAAGTSWLKTRRAREAMTADQLAS